MGMASGLHVGYLKKFIDVVFWIRGFQKNGKASGTFFLYIKNFKLKVYIASGGMFVYSNFLNVVGRLLYVPLWSRLQCHFTLSTAFHFEKVDVIFGVVEIGFGQVWRADGGVCCRHKRMFETDSF